MCVISHVNNIFKGENVGKHPSLTGVSGQTILIYGKFSVPPPIRLVFTYKTNNTFDNFDSQFMKEVAKLTATSHTGKLRIKTRSSGRWKTGVLLRIDSN